ncbi:LuxR family transcriptional regulator [Streptomyces sp. MMG1533]|uniref:helix-turn-helix transcriptional regulator n=1 Tax=Streptomyces sp. MMG1533 TaxID=1415546 RepID=UPI0006AEA07C|nr:helix-turn-helix transcriptional regulator [Streptomyces sp. MMG1533]KOU62197.1 LuxR family transcriptional regulator [Streptomyces sp. MMG1533]
MTEGHRHATEEVCEAGLSLYDTALRDGRVASHRADSLPCVVDSGLLQPDVVDPRWMRPVAPALALPRLVLAIEEGVARRRRHEERLVEAFTPLLEAAVPDAVSLGNPVIRLLSGLDQINTVIEQALNTAQDEVLTVQPGGKRPATALSIALRRDREVLARGCRMRTLYQHTTRHDPAVLAHYEYLAGDVEVRTLDEVPERLIVIDRSVAFVPASKDRKLALEVRHPALVDFFATTFDRLWRLATPMHPEAVQQPTLNGITPRQRAIAALLVEGHTDAVIADRLGMNIRTARVHIAKLAATLGSESRAQLGYLIGRSGILDQEA